MSQPDDNRWVPLFRALDQVQGRLTVARLNDLNIPVNFHDETPSQTTPTMFGMIANYIIFVPDEYYDRALAALADMGVLDEEDIEPYDDLDEEF